MIEVCLPKSRESKLSKSREVWTTDLRKRSFKLLEMLTLDHHYLLVKIYLHNSFGRLPMTAPYINFPMGAVKI